MPRRSTSNAKAIRKLAVDNHIVLTTRSGNKRTLQFLIKKLKQLDIPIPVDYIPKSSAFTKMCEQATAREIKLYTASGFRTRKTISNMITKTPLSPTVPKPKPKSPPIKFQQPTKATVKKARAMAINLQNADGKARSDQQLNRKIDATWSRMKAAMAPKTSEGMTLAEQSLRVRGRMLVNKYNLSV